MIGLWAALALTLSTVFLLAMRACGLSAFGGTVMILHCQPPMTQDEPIVTLQQEHLRQQALEDHLDRLRLRLVDAPHCPPPPEADVAEPEPNPATEPDLAEEAWDDRNLEMLEGCWQRISNLMIDDVDTGQVHAVRDWQMCFHADGSGEQRLEFDNGAVCSGPIDAVFLPDGRLQIRDLEDVPCDDGRGIYAHIAECTRLPDGTAECVARQPRIGREGIPSTFQR